MRRAKPLSEVWIHFERQKIDNKYMAKCKYEKQEKKRFFYLDDFFPKKKKTFFSTGKTIYITTNDACESTPGHGQTGITALTDTMPQELFLRAEAQTQGQRHPGFLNGG